LAVWICGEGPVIAQLRYGISAIVFANEYIGRAMYLWGEHDPRITDVLRAAIRSGDTVLDIGAHFGVTGLFAAKHVGPSGAVHLFEPQPLLATCLRTSLQVNGFAQAVVHECALSDKSGTAVMTVVDSSNWGATTLSPPKNGLTNGCASLSVRTEEAGRYITSLGCAHVSCVKIDVEGYEPIILESMREWLAEFRPPVIAFECHLNGTDFDSHSSVRILRELGYSFYYFDLRPYWRTTLHVARKGCPLWGGDFVAIHWDNLDGERTKALKAMIS
jgi:FkbM family methyltransferase